MRNKKKEKEIVKMQEEIKASKLEEINSKISQMSEKDPLISWDRHKLEMDRLYSLKRGII